MLALLLALRRFAQAIWRAGKNPEVRGLLLITAITLLFGMWFYNRVEGWRWLDALYFSVITLTTIGYGDFSPQTDLGKIFTMIYIFIGLGIILGFVNVIAEEMLKSSRRSPSETRDAAVAEQRRDA
jgi:hypothetical protein